VTKTVLVLSGHALTAVAAEEEWVDRYATKGSRSVQREYLLEIASQVIVKMRIPVQLSGDPTLDARGIDM